MIKSTAVTILKQRINEYLGLHGTCDAYDPNRGGAV